MKPTERDYVKEANAILSGSDSPNGEELRKLEKHLAKAGEDELARKIRLRRIDVDVVFAESVLSGGKESAVEWLKLAKRLADAKRIGIARRVLKRLRLILKRTDHAAIFIEAYQKSALYTYKDPDLPVEWRLDAALEILSEAEDLAATENQETLGLAGAIYKRKWEVNGLRQNLERALFYYVRGYALGIRGAHFQNDKELQLARADVIKYLSDNPNCSLWADDDRGYCGINAAFVLDLLAHEEESEARRAGFSLATGSEKRRGAQLIREEIRRSVPPLLGKAGNEWLADEWWFYATIGEAYFGTGASDPANYETAIEWLVEKPAKAGLKLRLGVETPAGMEVPEWEHESTARQLARLARLHCDPAITEENFETTDAGMALAKFLRNDEKAVRSTFRGKFGLGLSGGGFRASLFHIGVLARLAELEVLRHIEVLSCVSGGSIIGAHYYLELRKLLQTKTDDQIKPKDYVDIVKRIERDFLKGVQRNIRVRVLAEWVTNLKMIFFPGYTRTLRVGELYERELFSKVEDFEREGGDFTNPVTGPMWLPDWLARLLGYHREVRWLNDLYIQPVVKDQKDTNFNPRSHNWRRINKAPILILNAASLNTGHNWQFTASFMGEPPTPLNTDIDSNYRLRRMYYKDAPGKYKNFRLGHAVAASSAVPGLLEPLRLDGLYPYDDGKLKDEHLIGVRLVDGGACDNQGVASLLEQDCTVMLVSDASGQMEAQNMPGGGPLGVLLRTSNVVQARVREAQYTDMVSRRRSSLLRGFMFIHLRQDLSGEQLAWRDCPSGLKKSDFESKLSEPDDETNYGVHAELQRKLSAIRTDLDSFSDVEAYALMASGYRMTSAQFEGDNKCIEGFRSPQKAGPWTFLAIDDAMRTSSDQRRKHLENLVSTAAGAVFKVWKLSVPLRILKYALLAAALAALLSLFYVMWDVPFTPQAVYARVEQYLPEAVKIRIPALTFGLIGRTAVFTLIFTAIAIVTQQLLGRTLGKVVARGIDWKSTLRDITIGVIMGTVGFILARLHLHIFDPIYLRYGRLNKFPRKPPA